VLGSQKPLRASPQGQRDENANGDVIGNEHGIPTAQIAPNHLVSWGYSPTTLMLTLGRRLYRIGWCLSLILRVFNFEQIYPSEARQIWAVSREQRGNHGSSEE